MSRRRASLIPALALTAIAAGYVAAQPVRLRAIWITPLGSTAAIPAAVRAVAASRLDAIVLPVFYDGRVIYPSRVFPQHQQHQGTDPAAAVIAQAHARGLRVLAAVDLLYWQSSPDPSPALLAHPQWVERTAEGRALGDAPRAPGAFVSPVEPRVRALLEALAAELARRYDFDGVVIAYARWSRLDFLGYADPDRKAYLQERRVDPLDVDLLGYATPTNMIEALVSWQEQRIGEVTAAFAQAFRREEPQAMVLAVVEPRYYSARLTTPVRQDWRSWLAQPWLDAVIPDGIVYADPARARAELRQEAGMENPPVVALLRRSAAAPLPRQVQVASSLGLRGFIIWARDSHQQRRLALAELRGL